MDSYFIQWVNSITIIIYFDPIFPNLTIWNSLNMNPHYYWDGTVPKLSALHII